MNADKLEPGQRSASTSNRNFEGRQGRGGDHLVGPAMAAAAAIAGILTDVRDYGLRRSAMDNTQHRGVAAPMDMINIDTDMVYPRTSKPSSAPASASTLFMRCGTRGWRREAGSCLIKAPIVRRR